MKGVTATHPADPAVAERLRTRYPRPRLPRSMLVAATVLVTAVALGWLVWAAYDYATPAVSAQVSGYVVESDQRIRVTLTVDRPDPSVAVTCRVIAQAFDFQTVAEEEVRVPPGPDPLREVKLTMVTLRRASAAVAKGCTSDG